MRSLPFLLFARLFRPKLISESNLLPSKLDPQNKHSFSLQPTQPSSPLIVDLENATQHWTTERAAPVELWGSGYGVG